MTSPLRIALLVNPFTLGMKWGDHAPALARELINLGHTVRGFGAPQGAIPRSAPDPSPDGVNGADALGGLRGFAPDALIAYDALSPAAWLAARTARRCGAPLVLVEAGASGARSLRQRAAEAVGRLLWGRFVRSAAHGVFALDEVARARALGAGFPRGRVWHLPGGVDLSAYRPGLASGLLLRHHMRGRTLLYVGRIDAGRGLELLVRAFARTVGQRSDWSLVLAGEGPLRVALRAQADRLGISSRVRWFGRVREEELPGLMSASTLLAVPATSDSVRGRNIPRAMASGLPVIASDLPSLAALVAHEATGLTVAAGDLEAWVAALQRASMSPEGRQRWRTEGRRLAEERYAWPGIARAFERALLRAEPLAVIESVPARSA